MLWATRARFPLPPLSGAHGCEVRDLGDRRMIKTRSDEEWRRECVLLLAKRIFVRIAPTTRRDALVGAADVAIDAANEFYAAWDEYEKEQRGHHG